MAQQSEKIHDNNVINENAYEFSLDAILVRIGQFGKFQILILLVICIPMIFDAVFSVVYIFLMATVTHRCRVPECDGPNSIYEELSTEFTIPKTIKGRLDKCHRFIPYNRSIGIDHCYAENYDQQTKEECGTDLIFRDEELTVSNDFNIYCADEWKLALAGTVNNVGQFIGIPLGGYFSDRYGRKKLLAIGGFLSGIMGLIRSFSPNFYMFLAFGFLDNLCGSSIYGTVFILGIEFVGPKIRVIGCSVISMFYVAGEIILALVAKTLQDWRLILRFFYTPALGMITLLWILPESVRWLLSKGEEEKATLILKRAAAINKRKLPDASIYKLLKANRIKLAKADEGKLPIREAFHLLGWRIFNCSFCWFTHVLVYYGLSLNSVTLAGNKYDNFMYISLVEFPGLLVPYLVMERIGRRYTLVGCLAICGICIAATIFVRSDSVPLQLILFLLGKMAITASFQVLYFFTSEIFPTSVRNSLLSFCSMFGRLGSMVAPQTPLMAKYYVSAPAILFAGSAFLSAFLAFLLPETKDIVLPTTLQEAKKIGQNEIINEPEAKEKLLESKV